MKKIEKHLKFKVNNLKVKRYGKRYNIRQVYRFSHDDLILSSRIVLESIHYA